MALVLVDMHGLPVAEAAQVLGVAEGTVKSRCFRGREALADLLGGPDGTGTTGGAGSAGGRAAETGRAPQDAGPTAVPSPTEPQGAP